MYFVRPGRAQHPKQLGHPPPGDLRCFLKVWSTLEIYGGFSDAMMLPV